MTADPSHSAAAVSRPAAGTSRPRRPVRAVPRRQAAPRRRRSEVRAPRNADRGQTGVLPDPARAPTGHRPSSSLAANPRPGGAHPLPYERPVHRREERPVPPRHRHRHGQQAEGRALLSEDAAHEGRVPGRRTQADECPAARTPRSRRRASAPRWAPSAATSSACRSTARVRTGPSRAHRTSTGAGRARRQSTRRPPAARSCHTPQRLPRRSGATPARRPALRRECAPRHGQDPDLRARKVTHPAAALTAPSGSALPRLHEARGYGPPLAPANPFRPPAPRPSTSPHAPPRPPPALSPDVMPAAAPPNPPATHKPPIE